MAPLILPTELPEQWWHHIEVVADELLGKPRRPLGALVGEVSALYTRQRRAIATATHVDTLQARLRFFLPRDLIKTLFPLQELWRANALPRDRPWRVLDVGAGFGTTTLGASWFAALSGATSSLDVQAVEQIPTALRGFEALCAQPPGVPVSLETLNGDARKSAFRGSNDLILVGLMLNELAANDAAKFVLHLAQHLAPGGSIVVIEPALREVTRQLQSLRDELIATSPLSVFAPCLHQHACPMLANPKDWCHEERPFQLPGPLRAVARSAGLRADRSTFAYLTLRSDGMGVALAGADDFRVVSTRLKTKGKLELVGCHGDGRLEKLMRLDRHASTTNAAFGDARRGHLLQRSGTGRVGVAEEVTRLDDSSLDARAARAAEAKPKR